jgi:hypothetical protein
MTQWTILKFPNLTDFYSFLKQRGIHEYGEVIIEDRRTGKQGITYVSYSIRLTAKDPERSEIVQCELLFYNGIWLGADATREESKASEKKFKEYVEKTHSEAFKDYGMAVIPAEFKAVAEEVAE